MSDYLTVRELSDRLGFSRTWIFKQIARGNIKADWIGGRWLIKKKDAPAKPTWDQKPGRKFKGGVR